MSGPFSFLSIDFSIVPVLVPFFPLLEAILSKELLILKQEGRHLKVQIYGTKMHGHWSNSNLISNPYILPLHDLSKFLKHSAIGFLIYKTGTPLYTS